MNKLILAIASTLCLAVTSGTVLAAATLTFGFSVGTTSVISTGIACSPVSTTLVAPVATGVVITSCVVSPSAWAGTITLSNPALAVAVTGTNTFNLVVPATALVAGTYTETVTSSP